MVVHISQALRGGLRAGGAHKAARLVRGPERALGLPEDEAGQGQLLVVVVSGRWALWAVERKIRQRGR